MFGHRSLTALLVVSVVLNVLLAFRLHFLRTSAPSAPLRLEVGVAIGPFKAYNGTGSPVEVTPADGRHITIMYFFNKHCRWCEHNVKSVAALAKALGAEYRIVGVAISDSDISSEESRYPFPLYSNPDPAAIHQLRLEGTPQTIVVDPEGRVLHNWLGPYGGPVRKSIESAFKVALAGEE